MSLVGRILWNDVEDIDELVLHNPEMVHIEQMDDRCWWIAIYLDDHRFWSGNFVANSRGRMRFVEQANEGVKWDENRTHGEAQL